MNTRQRVEKERDRFMARTDSDHDGRVSAAEVRARAEREITKRPWRAVAIVAALTAVAVVAYFALVR